MFGAALYGGYYFGGGAPEVTPGQIAIVNQRQAHITIADQRQAHVTITAKH